jgi:hypothetical protein
MREVPHDRRVGRHVTTEEEMACRTEFESEEAWRYYLDRATEQEAYDALGEVLRLAGNFAHKHKATSKRMHKMFDAGAAIYADRFGREWAPF